MSNRFRDWYRSKASRPLILAHRGDSFRSPENTIEAAILGHLNGADGWELDVQLTSDKIPIVVHDDSLMRTTNVTQVFEGDPRGETGFLVGDFILAEVQSLNAGGWFIGLDGRHRSAINFGTRDHLPAEQLDRYGSGSVRIPTLAEALDLTIQLDWMVNVEIKSAADDPDGLVDAVLNEIRRANAWDRVAISSFNLDFVRQIASREIGVATGALVDDLSKLPTDFHLRRWGIDATHLPPDCFDPNNSTLPQLIYTVNDAGPDGLAFRLFERGASGFFTDDPASMAVRFGGHSILRAHQTPLGDC